MAPPLTSITVVSIITAAGIPTAGSSVVSNLATTISGGSTAQVSLSSATFNALCAGAFSAAGGSLT